MSRPDSMSGGCVRECFIHSLDSAEPTVVGREGSKWEFYKDFQCSWGRYFIDIKLPAAVGHCWTFQRNNETWI